MFFIFFLQMTKSSNFYVISNVIKPKKIDNVNKDSFFIHQIFSGWFTYAFLFIFRDNSNIQGESGSWCAMNISMDHGCVRFGRKSKLLLMNYLELHLFNCNTQFQTFKITSNSKVLSSSCAWWSKLRIETFARLSFIKISIILKVPP